MFELLILIVLGFMGIMFIGLMLIIISMIYEEHKNGKDYR